MIKVEKILSDSSFFVIRVSQIFLLSKFPNTLNNLLLQISNGRFK